MQLPSFDATIEMITLPIGGVVEFGEAGFETFSS
jgi:hypothetical protein